MKILLAAILIAASGCAVVPIIGQRQIQKNCNPVHNSTTEFVCEQP